MQINSKMVIIIIYTQNYNLFTSHKQIKKLIDNLYKHGHLSIIEHNFFDGLAFNTIVYEIHNLKPMLRGFK